MSKVSYTKSALSYADQIQQLKQRGLVIENEPKAIHLLETISYYYILQFYWMNQKCSEMYNRYYPIYTARKTQY